MHPVSRSFSREQRLLSPRQFKLVFDSPSGRVSGGQVLLLVRQNDLEHPRLGLVIGKKNVKLSVERNRIKRQIRESFRHHQGQIGNWDVVVIARKGVAEQQNPELAKHFGKLWKRLGHMKPANPIPDPESKISDA